MIKTWKTSAAVARALAAGVLSVGALTLGACAVTETATTSATAPVAAAPAAESLGALKALSSADMAALDAVLADARRDEDRARDGERNPRETLAFFGVTPDMTVAEVLPGGGWYSRILVPYVGEKGAFYGVNYSLDTFKGLFGDGYEQRREALEGWSASFPEQAAAWGPEGSNIAGAFHFGSMPEDVAGTVDVVFAPRALHNMKRLGTLDAAIADMYAMLKPGGIAAIVQHRAKPDASDAYADGSKGYLREADVIADFEKAGFKTLRLSEVNANPKDTADYEGGVWTLPPRLALGDVDKATYEAIGESDRMTIAFQKPKG